MCGVIGVYNVLNPLNEILDGLHALQHRGQEAVGVALADGKSFIPPSPSRIPGVVRDYKKWPGALPSTILLGTGHVRYATSGSHVSIENAQPLIIPTRFGPFTLAHNGDMPGFEKDRSRLEQIGVKFLSTADTEVLGESIAVKTETAETLEEAMLEVLANFKGAFSLVMSTASSLIGCRDPFGYRPLCLGRLQNGWVLASETCALQVLRAEYVRDIEPGELVWIDEKGLKSFKFGEPKSSLQQCVFELIYFSRPDSMVFGRYADGMRKALGEKLAEEVGELLHEDMIFVPVLNSGMYAADGYARRTGVILDHALVRNGYSERTFIKNEEKNRDDEVRTKFNPISHRIIGKWVVLIDDSLVRGTTMRRLVRMMKENGAVGVTLLIASPPIFHPCRYGIDMKTYDQLLAAIKKGEIEEIRKFVEADELCYLSLEGLHQVVEEEGESKNFCFACFDGKYAL